MNPHYDAGEQDVADRGAHCELRAMVPADVDVVAALHVAHLSYSFFAKLGLPFVRRVYQRLVASEHGVGFVYESAGVVQAFIAAAVDSAALRREFVLKSGFAVGIDVLCAAARKPRLVIPVLETLAYGAKTDLPDVRAEMLFISIDPALRGHGLAVRFICRVLEEFVARGVERVKVTTEAANDPVNRLLAKFGFEEQRSFRLHGKGMLLHARSLAGFPDAGGLPTGP